MQTTRPAPSYIVLPSARETELDDAHMRAPSTPPATPPRSPFQTNRPSARRSGLNSARVATIAGAALALEALRLAPKANAQWPGPFADPFAGMDALYGGEIRRRLDCNNCLTHPTTIAAECGAYGFWYGGAAKFACKKAWELVKAQCVSKGCPTA